MRGIGIKMTTKCSRHSDLHHLHVEKWRTTQVDKPSMEESDPYNHAPGSSPAYTLCVCVGGVLVLPIPFHHLWALQLTQKGYLGTVWLKPSFGSTGCKFHLHNEVKSPLTFPRWVRLTNAHTSQFLSDSYRFPLHISKQIAENEILSQHRNCPITRQYNWEWPPKHR